MRKDREKALRLRLSGMSYAQIQKELEIPKSTLSDWFNGVVLSEKAKERIAKRYREKSRLGLLRRNKRQTALAIQRARTIRSNAARAISMISGNELLILGISLYWAEGYKRPMVRNGRELTCHTVSLTNSDPTLIKAFMRFLMEYCSVPIEKIKIALRIFEHQNASEIQEFWQKTTGIPKRNFGKTYRGISKSSMGKRPYNRLPYGVAQIVVADTKLFHQIMGYIEGLKKLM